MCQYFLNISSTFEQYRDNTETVLILVNIIVIRNVHTVLYLLKSSTNYFSHYTYHCMFFSYKIIIDIILDII